MNSDSRQRAADAVTTCAAAMQDTTRAYNALRQGIETIRSCFLDDNAGELGAPMHEAFLICDVLLAFDDDAIAEHTRALLATEIDFGEWLQRSMKTLKDNEVSA